MARGWRDLAEQRRDRFESDHRQSHGEFKTVSGWITPADQGVTITDGATTTPSGIYVQLVSSITFRHQWRGGCE